MPDSPVDFSLSRMLPLEDPHPAQLSPSVMDPRGFLTSPVAPAGQTVPNPSLLPTPVSSLDASVSG